MALPELQRLYTILLMRCYLKKRRNLSWKATKKVRKATPVTPDEADDIRVTLDLDNGSVECKIITIFDADHKDYIALLPLDKNGNENESGEVYLYRYFEDEEGLPRIENIESDDEYEAAADRFDELLDDEMFDDI